MDEQVSRRRFLASAGLAAVGSIAGCSLAPDADETTAAGDGGDDALIGGRDVRAAESGTGADERTPPDLDIETPAETPAPSSDSEYTQLYRSVIDSVPAIRVRTGSGQGSGTAWMYDEQHFVTNEHIVGDATSAALRFQDDGWRSAEIVGSDAYSDLGVVRTDPPDDTSPLPLVDQQTPVGTEVVAIGNPFGLSGSVTAGIVSGNNRSLMAPNNFTIPDAIQTDAAANPGNSGGPLMTLDGAVAGVVNSGIQSGDNIGFAISAALTERVVPDLIADGEYDHPYMGINYEDVDPAITRANNLPVTWGIYVHRVVDGGPSDGVLEGSTGRTFVNGESVNTGGDVIVNMDGTVIQTQGDLGSFLALRTSPGDTVDVTVIRDGGTETVPLTLGERPEP